MSLVNRGYGRGNLLSAVTPGYLALGGYGRTPLLLVLYTAIKRIQVIFNQAVRIEVER